MIYVYLDESGDLGWSFDKPYRHGGSSRYLTIAALIIPGNLRKYPKRIVRDIYTKTATPPSEEIKGSLLAIENKIIFARKVVSFSRRDPRIKIRTITVYKPNVQNHIRADHNKLYNYMTKLVLLDEIKSHPRVTFIPDERSIKVECGNSLIDYLQTELWFEKSSTTVINNSPQSSCNNLNLQFIDFVSNIVWKKYEDSKTEAYNIMCSRIGEKHLFFPREEDDVALVR